MVGHVMMATGRWPTASCGLNSRYRSAAAADIRQPTLSRPAGKVHFLFNWRFIVLQFL